MDHIIILRMCVTSLFWISCKPDGLSRKGVLQLIVPEENCGFCGAKTLIMCGTRWKASCGGKEKAVKGGRRIEQNRQIRRP